MTSPTDVTDTPARRRPSPAVRALRAVLLIAAVALALLAVRGQWGRLGERASELSAVGVALSFALALASLAASALAYHASLAALGNALPRRVAARIYLVGQLGKYLPGSVWPVVAQMHMASEAGVPRARGAVAALLALGVGVVGAVPLALLGMPALLDVLGAPPLAVVAGVVLLTGSLGLLHPRLLSWLVRVLLRMARRPLPELDLPAAGVLRVAACTVTAVGLAGCSVAVLAWDVGATAWSTIPLAVGAYAAASAAGLLAVPVPAGAGVREAVLIAGLAPALPVTAGLVVAVASRLVLTVADLAASALSVTHVARRAQALEE